MEGKRGRGKTRIERYSENLQVTNSQEAHWREKVKEIELSARTANRHR